VVAIDIASGDFQAKAILTFDWKVLFSQNNEERTLPVLTKNQSLICADSVVVDKQTQPPKHFSDATLLSAMTGGSRFVKDPAIRKVLKDTDGLGTEATRAHIIV
jgi:DNA topoisomerase-3